MVLEFLMGGEMILFFLFDGFVVLTLMLVERPTLLATFFSRWLVAPWCTYGRTSLRADIVGHFFCLIIL